MCPSLPPDITSLLLHAALCLSAWYSELGAVECRYSTSSVDTDAIQAMTDVVFGIPEILHWPKCSRLIIGCFLLSEIIIKSFSVLFTSPVSGGEWRLVLALCSVLQLWHQYINIHQPTIFFQTIYASEPGLGCWCWHTSTHNSQLTESAAFKFIADHYYSQLEIGTCLQNPHWWAMEGLNGKAPYCEYWCKNWSLLVLCAGRCCSCSWEIMMSQAAGGQRGSLCSRQLQVINN